MNHKIAVIILNFNNWTDTIECLKLLRIIDYPRFFIVVVDNGSSDNSIEKIASWAKGELLVIEYDRKIAEHGGTEELEDELCNYLQNQKVVIIKNNTNLGYSAGNNVGVRYAIKKNADAILIVNPDVRVEDPNTLNKMVETMFSRDDIFVVGPTVVDSEGNRQSPLREPTFWEECLNPFASAIIKRIGRKSLDYIEPIKSNDPYEVEKVVGACLMIKTSFLKEIGLLDERVFLYCEEPILMYQVQKHKGMIIFRPSVTVKHLHRAKKENIFQYKEFMKSRLYFLSRYKRYTFWQIALIKASYSLVLLIKIFKFMR